jgi:hypothetical protein
MFARSNPMRWQWRAAFIVAAVSCGACSATMSSSEVRTSGLIALIDVTAERNDAALVSADVMVGGERDTTRVVLEDGDQLFAEVAGDKREMSSVGNGSYQAEFPRCAGEFVVSLSRSDDRAAPRSVGSMPPAIELASSFGERSLSRAKDDVTLSWSPSGSDSDVSIELEGDCVRDEQLRVEGDPGRYVIPAGTISAWHMQEKETCNVALRLVLTRKGTTDPALSSDSSFQLRQVRATRIVSAP